MKSFQQALEKRVARGTKTDKQTVFHATKQVVGELFGLSGRDNVTVFDWKNGVLFLVCEKSVWRAEIFLNKNKIMEMVNCKCKNKTISEIKIRQFSW